MGAQLICQVRKELEVEKVVALGTGDTEKDISQYSHNYCSDHHENASCDDRATPRRPK